MTIVGMRIACWKHKATYTQSEYVILIALSLQQWLHELATILRYSTLFVLLKLRQPLDRTKRTDTFQIRQCSSVGECRSFW
jgi:hypothetical protein